MIILITLTNTNVWCKSLRQYSSINYLICSMWKLNESLIFLNTSASLWMRILFWYTFFSQCRIENMFERKWKLNIMQLSILFLAHITICSNLNQKLREFSLSFDVFVFIQMMKVFRAFECFAYNSRGKKLCLEFFMLKFFAQFFLSHSA